MSKALWSVLWSGSLEIQLAKLWFFTTLVMTVNSTSVHMNLSNFSRPLSGHLGNLLGPSVSFAVYYWTYMGNSTWVIVGGATGSILGTVICTPKNCFQHNPIVLQGRNLKLCVSCDDDLWIVFCKKGQPKGNLHSPDLWAGSRLRTSILFVSGWAWIKEGWQNWQSVHRIYLSV